MIPTNKELSVRVNVTPSYGAGEHPSLQHGAVGPKGHSFTLVQGKQRDRANRETGDRGRERERGGERDST